MDLSIFNPLKRSNKSVLKYNPTLPPVRQEPANPDINVVTYTKQEVQTEKVRDTADCREHTGSGKLRWINIAGLKKQNVEEIGEIFNIHSLITEDILSMGQRPKMDEMDNLIFALLYMLHYDEQSQSVEIEQVSILLEENTVISFQENVGRDMFAPVMNKLELKDTRLRNYKSDYLFYTLIDTIVDSYFVVLEKLGEKIEFLEDEIIRNATTSTLNKINLLRKEMVLLKRNISPVRELINGILRSESELIDERTERYFKDIYDHIVQANDLSENYRDIVMSLHDLYLSELNLKMNEAMKVMAIVTCLLAPATVIGGIFGMNFSVMPWLGRPSGFYVAVGVMLLIPVWMIYIFKKRGWF